MNHSRLVVALAALPLVCLSVPARGQEPPPAAAARQDEAPTAAGLWRRWMAIEEEQLLSTFRAGTGKDARWDEGVEALFRRFPSWSISNWTEDSPASIAAQAKKLIDLGCADPMVLYIHAMTSDDWKLTSGSLKHYERAAAALAASDYPRHHLVFVRHRIAEHHKLWRKPAESAKAMAEAGAAATEAARQMHQRGIDPRFQRYLLVNFIKDQLDEPNANAVVEALLKAKDVDRWLALELAGECQIRAAWRARGGGWAVDVKEENWDEFHGHLAKARRLLEAAHEMEPSRPEAAAGLITVTMGDRGPKPNEARLWFDRAVRAQFDWEDAYRNYSWALRPRWGGSHEKMLAFGEECRASRRYDTLVPYYFVQVLLAIAEDERDYWTIWSRNPAWYDQAREALEETSKRIERPYLKRWTASLSATVAWLNQRQKDGFQSLERIEFRIDERAVADVGGLSAEAVMRDLICLGGPAAEAHARAQEAARNGDFATMAEVCARVVRELPITTPGPIADALWSRSEAARQLADFRTGKDAALIPNASLAGWRVLGGWWTVGLERQRVQARIRERELPSAISYARFGEEFEVEGEIDFGPQVDDLTEAGFLFGVDSYRDDPAWYSARLAPGGRVRIGPALSESSAVTVQGEPQPSGPQRLRITVRGGKIAVMLNGKGVYDGEIPKYAGPNTARACVGLWAAPPPRASIWFSNVVVRRPAPVNGDGPDAEK